MDEAVDPSEDLLATVPRVFERLSQIPGYIWDDTIKPFHSSYDNWHVFGLRRLAEPTRNGSGNGTGSGSGSGNGSINGNGTPSSDISKITSIPSSPRTRPPLASINLSPSESGSDNTISELTRGDEPFQPVVARISTHVLRLEREYHLCLSLIEASNGDTRHLIKPIELIRLSTQQGDPGPVAVSIVEAPGKNYLKELMDFGPAWYRSAQPGAVTAEMGFDLDRREQISLLRFLDFAIGASECLELLHHGRGTIHGEIRGDAFHFNEDTGLVKLINFGSGVRSFEHGLTSAKWSSLSKEVGAMNKLQFIAPEQTGRMPSSPDSRTDIYSLGILFWTMLTGEPAFDGQTPMEIVQRVIGRRIPTVTSRRLDVPNAVSAIIQKMTMKQMDERYNSAGGLKYDLLQVQQMLGNGDADALASFEIATRDVSSMFSLPTVMVGRQAEHDLIVNVLSSVSKRHTVSVKTKVGLSSMSSNSSASASDVHLESLDAIDASSEDSGSQGQQRSRSDSGIVDPASIGAAAPNGLTSSHESASTTGSWPPLDPADFRSRDGGRSPESRPSLHGKPSVESGLSRDRTSAGTDHVHAPGSLVRRRNSTKRSRNARCEVISIAGDSGFGKSRLMQSIRSEARRYGYLATAKFDSAKNQPFQPVLKVMSSLFRQIFSESDVSTEFHHLVRGYVRPVWAVLSNMLDLPDSLLGPTVDQAKAQHAAVTSHHKSIKSDPRRDMSSLSSTSSSINGSAGPQSTSDFLHGPTSTKSLRFMNIFLDVLRLLAHNKFICLCLDDLHFADEESLELLSNIVAAKIKVVVIITYRPEEFGGGRFRSVLESESANITRIDLKPLTEDSIIEYVAIALHRPRDYVIALAAVVQEKTRGSPFLMKELLDQSYRKRCLWYDWKSSSWVYDLDQIFKEFEADNYGQQLNNDFIIRRLNELPPTTKSILAWASLLGNEFSFALVQRLLSGEFDYDDAHSATSRCGKADVLSQPGKDAVAGLQAALQAYVLAPREDDDLYRFSNDRYMLAAASLRECSNIKKMHFIIAQTMMKYNSLDDRDIYDRSAHVCRSIDIIKERVAYRSSFRELLLHAAQRASETGAWPTALYYHRHCKELLQPDPWKDGPDVYYDETLQLFTHSSECSWAAGHYEEAQRCLGVIFEKARSPIDKAQSWVLRSRILSRSGNSHAAFQALKQCLASLGLELQDDMSWEQCDEAFREITEQLKTLDKRKFIDEPPVKDRTVAAMGAVFVELVSAAFWSDSLLFYQMVIKMIRTHFSIGTFAQVGLGYSYCAIIAIGRFNMIRFGLELSDTAQAFIAKFQDSYALFRSRLTYWLMVGHLQSHVRDGLPALEASMEDATATGDHALTLLNIATIAVSKLAASEDLAEVDYFCTYMPEDLNGYESDYRGGTMVMAVRQVSRALQGKTKIDSGSSILSGDGHDSDAYLSQILRQSSKPSRALDFYNALSMIPLYLYRHFDAAVAKAESCLPTIDELWSMRVTRLMSFYYALTLLALLRRDPLSDGKEQILEKVRLHKKRIEDWSVEESVNYRLWAELIKAELCEATRDFGDAIKAYETAIDEAERNGFGLEEALSNELMAGFFLRRGANRAAQMLIRSAIAAYRRISAHGKAIQVTREHQWLLSERSKMQSVDVACQASLGGEETTRLEVDENQRQITRDGGEESTADRTRDWIGPKTADEDDDEDDRRHANELPGLGIDVIDLQSILSSSQIISSELQVDKLLPKMCELILEGNSADSAAIIVEEEDSGWVVAARGNPDGDVMSYRPGLPLAEDEVDDQIPRQVALYCLRFREVVFLQNVLADERFCNVSEQYLSRNPAGRSVITIPILHGGNTLLGALYLEGPPNSFTDRNLTVLQLLVNQMGISIANALLFKKVQRVSASNTAMIDSQKRALAQAREAEVKAKRAEAQAVHSLKLKEEAAKAKSIFLANVSHELRTPLNGVIGMSELLKGTEMTSQQDGYADSIRVCADTLLTVINDILDYSKLEAGKMQLVNIPFNLHEAIQEVVRALACTHQEQGLETVERIALPPLLVMGDPVRVHQIMMNLLSNSYKFTQQGSVTVEAVVEAESEVDIHIRCSVRDTGIGINPQQVKRLFMPFSQADSSTARKYGGSGLGLSICKNLITAMNGEIGIDSDEGEGTTVTFSLTLQKAPKDAAAAAAAAATSTTIAARNPDPMSIYTEPTEMDPSAPVASHIDLSRVPRSELRICIAEDNHINQQIAISFVKRLGFHVDAYDNGRAAVDALRECAAQGSPYHLVLMDVQMPELDGYEATRLLRRDPEPAVRLVLVIAMTASAIRGDREKCLEAGMNNYLAKPVRANVLKEMLEQYLQQPARHIPELQREAAEMARLAVSDDTAGV
ncbi:MAG: hypothetical protein M1825_006093 [Sarcosagium campestre]|nr:MAG: hypothetical protein M1825_006093 [Sarcosagium campestre]